MNFIMKHRGKIILIGAIILVLIMSFLFGDGVFEASKTPTPKISESLSQTIAPVPTIEAANQEDMTPAPAPTPDAAKAPNTATPAASPSPTAVSTPSPTPSPESNSALYCTLSVRCDKVFESITSIAPEKLQLIPENGLIYPEQQVVFYEGESVFNLLSREMKKNKIHLEFVQTPAYDSMYIEGIGNLYQFDCGELSGWIYRVNGKTPSIGCSLYELKSGDKVEFIYTCDLGNDI